MLAKPFLKEKSKMLLLVLCVFVFGLRFLR